MRQSREPPRTDRENREKMLRAVSRLIAAERQEWEKIIEENPVLLTDDAIRFIDEVVADFDDNVTIIKDFPREWKRRGDYLRKLANKKGA